MNVGVAQLLTLSVSILFIRSVSCSACVVTYWSEWQTCIGNCHLGLQVRNRDVVRPPFPERTDVGRLAIRSCPVLYQIQTCSPLQCSNDSDAGVTSGPISSNDTIQLVSTAAFPTPAAALIEDEQVHSNRIDSAVAAGSRRPVSPRLSPIPNTSSAAADDEDIVVTIPSSAGANSTELPPFGDASHGLLTSTAVPIVDIDQDEEEGSGGSNVGDAQLDAVPMVASKEAVPINPLVHSAVFNSDADIDSASGDSNRTTDLATCATNRFAIHRRCCRRSVRFICADGRKPQIVIRWARQEGDGDCYSYGYSYCGIGEESLEKPIKFEQDCHDLCFTADEKRSRV